MISQETIDEILDRANLVEVISENVQLRRAGANYVGLCPFHNEKTPSFNIREGGTYYRCFGCGASGNVITYVMHNRGVSFPDAVEELASRFGVEVKREGKQVKRKKTADLNALYKINHAAYSFFSNSLKNAPDGVKKYLSERDLSAELIKKFGIGYAPQAWSELTDHLRNKKVSEQLLLNLGLARRAKSGDLIDAFRGRLIFPIWIDSRRIAGFGGRVIPQVQLADDHKPPKYINSPESPIYHKKKTLYGVPQALTCLRENSEVYLVEGYMDVVGLARVNVNNTVATCGTAVTEQHIRRLRLLVKRVILLFDGDQAGRTAAGKAFSLFLNSGIDAFAVFLPDDEDPDTIARKYKKQTVEKLAEYPKESLLSCYIESLLYQYGLQSTKELGAATKGTLCSEVAKQLRTVENAVERSALLQEAAFKLMVTESELKAVMQGEAAEVKVKEETETISQQGWKSVELLPAHDSAILTSLMALRGDKLKEIVMDEGIVNELDPSTRAFLETLYSIVSTDEELNAEQKEQVKSLLSRFGPTWRMHWTKAHHMQQDQDVDLAAQLNQCLAQVKKNQLFKEVKRLEELAANLSDSQKALELHQQRVVLERKLREL